MVNNVKPYYTHSLSIVAMCQCWWWLQAAEEGKMDPLVGRAAELERTIQILARRQKNNPAPGPTTLNNIE